jgi:hypothetical protein
MKAKSAASRQMPLMLPADGPVELPDEVTTRLVTALADLLLAVAVQAARTPEGGSDERQDP